MNRFMPAILWLLLPCLAGAINVQHQIIKSEGKSWLLIVALETDDTTGQTIRFEQSLVSLDESGQAPIKVDRLTVVIIEESAERNKLTRGQLSIISSALVREEIEKAGGRFRLVDDDLLNDPTSAMNAPDYVKDSLALEREGLPWLVVATAKSGESVMLPETVDEFRALLEKYQ